MSDHAFVALCPLGVFAYHPQVDRLDHILFPTDPKKAAKMWLTCQRKELCEPEKKLIELLAGEESFFENAKLGQKHVWPNACGKYLRENLGELAIKHGFSKDRAGFVVWMRDFNEEVSKAQMRERFSADVFVVAAVGSLEEIEKEMNSAAMRLREWAGWWIPETVQDLKDSEDLAREILKSRGEKDSPKVSEADVKAIRSQAQLLLSIIETRSRIEKYIDSRLKEVAPRMREVAGPILSARLVAAAGSLETLAKMPASTIQILGAEKALFRHLRKMGRAPKHGLILAHPDVQKAKDRGKAARKLAAAISKAARMDFYRGGK